MINTITQSMYKDFEEYTLGNYCGLQFVARYIDGIEFPASEAMNAGSYFEWLITGSLPKSGKVPVAEFTKAGKLTSIYERAQAHLLNWEKLVQAYNIEPIHKGIKLISEHMEGTLDMEAMVNGQRSIIDFKFTGKMADTTKWDQFSFARDFIHDKPKLLIQAKQYVSLVYLTSGDIVPFYFACFSSTNDTDFDFIKIEASLDVITYHTALMKRAFEAIKQEFNNGFKPIPDYKRCSECPLKESCQYKTNIPTPFTVTL